MMRIDGMRQFREKYTLESGHPVDPGEYLLAAYKYVGSITHCDIPSVRNAARRLQCGPEMLAMGGIAVRKGMPEELGWEFWIRGMLHETFDGVLAEMNGNANGGACVEALRGLLFDRLYPV
jgi:hypothetical protein